MFNLYIFSKLKIIHGDLHLNNILIKNERNTLYNMYIFTINKKTFYIPTNGINIRFWDYGYSFATSDSDYVDKLKNYDIYMEMYNNCGFPDMTTGNYNFDNYKHYDLFVFCYKLKEILRNTQYDDAKNFLEDIIPSNIFLNTDVNYGRLINDNKKKSIMTLENIFEHKYFVEFAMSSMCTDESKVLYFNKDDNCMYSFKNKFEQYKLDDNNIF